MELYRERSGRGRTWGILLAVGAVAWLVLWLANDRGWVVPTALVGIVGGAVALVLAGSGDWQDVTLTPSELRVGRDRIPLSEIVPDLVAGPDEMPQVGTSGLLSGATPPARLHRVHLVLRDGRQTSVPARDPDALAQALRDALG